MMHKHFWCERNAGGLNDAGDICNLLNNMIIKRLVRGRAGSKDPVPSLFHDGAPTGLVADVPTNGRRCGAAKAPAGAATTRAGAGLR
jgi:hypothetical protein